MLTWEQMDILHQIATDCTKSAEQREKDIRDKKALWRFQEQSDKLRQWHSAVNMGPITSDYIMSHETTHSTHSAPISPYQAIPTHSGNIGAHGFALHVPYSS